MIYKAEHSGTHTDAPAHFTEGSWRIGDIPIDRLVGPGVVIDIEKSARFKLLYEHFNDHLIKSCNHYFDGIIQPVR